MLSGIFLFVNGCFGIGKSRKTGICCYIVYSFTLIDGLLIGLEGGKKKFEKTCRVLMDEVNPSSWRVICFQMELEKRT